MPCKTPGSPSAIADACSPVSIPFPAASTPISFTEGSPFQAGLSWITILHKREAFKEAFDQFDVNKIAMYDDCKINELMNNPKIIRNSRKIKAAVKNAQIFIEIQKEYGSFSKYLWAYTNDKIIYEKKENETTSTLSDQISKDLKKKGMSFVGSITIYSYLEAIGIYNHHDRNCFLHL